MNKKIFISIIFAVSSVFAKDIIIKRDIKIYQVPFQYSNNLNKIQQNGAVIKEQKSIKRSKTWEDKNLLILFKTNNKKYQILSLIKVLKEKTKTSSDCKQLLNILQSLVNKEY